MSALVGVRVNWNRTCFEWAESSWLICGQIRLLTKEKAKSPSLSLCSCSIGHLSVHRSLNLLSLPKKVALNPNVEYFRFGFSIRVSILSPFGNLDAQHRILVLFLEICYKMKKQQSVPQFTATSWHKEDIQCTRKRSSTTQGHRIWQNWCKARLRGLCEHPIKACSRQNHGCCSGTTYTSRGEIPQNEPPRPLSEAQAQCRASKGRFTLCPVDRPWGRGQTLLRVKRNGLKIANHTTKIIVTFVISHFDIVWCYKNPIFLKYHIIWLCDNTKYHISQLVTLQKLNFLKFIISHFQNI